MLNKCEITDKTLKYSITGGNQEIINILKEKEHSFEECLEKSFKYHRYELTTWLDENHKCKPVSLKKCIEYFMHCMKQMALEIHVYMSLAFF